MPNGPSSSSSVRDGALWSTSGTTVTHVSNAVGSCKRSGPCCSPGHRSTFRTTCRGRSCVPTIPDLVFVIALDWTVEVRSPEQPFRVLARLDLDYRGRAATLGKLRGQPALLIQTGGGLLAWSPWIDPQPLAELPVMTGSFVSDIHRLANDQLRSALVNDRGVLGLARDLELYETHVLGHDDIGDLLWLPQGDLICRHNRGLWRVRGSELEPVLKKKISLRL